MMRPDRRRSTTSLLLLLLLCLLSVGPLISAAEGQYFGRNKVRYESFEFKVLRTEHFDIYYYPQEEEAVEQAGRMAERWYLRLSRLLNHELKGRQPIILYASHPDFEQTSAIPGEIGEATGGVTEALKRRIVLPLVGPLSETDHVLGHELVHAFQFDITTRNRSAVGGGMPTALQLPLWFIEGMAEYLSLGPVDPHTAMWMRDAVRRDEFPAIRDLNDPRYFPYRYGQALWAYIAGRWGDPIVGEILKSAGKGGDALFAISTVLNMRPDSLSNAWREATRLAYAPVAEQTQAAEEYGREVLGPGKGRGNLNIAPALSPDGREMVFLSEKDRFSIEMFLADVETGEIKRKILKTAVDPHFESLQFIHSAGAWHPDGRSFVFSAVSRGRAIVTVIDVERGDVTREYVVPEAGEIYSPSWSPDGRYLVFSAITGGASDLFLIETESGEVRRLTDDLYGDMQPSWSPDGRRIAFVTDRFGSDLSTLSMGEYRLALIDPESGAVQRLPGFQDGKHINPQWSPEGADLYFLSDANGVTNLYRLRLHDGQIFQVTDLLVGISGITPLSPALSVAADARRVAFSAYRGNGYGIYVIDSVETLAGESWSARASLSPAMLPPLSRPVGDVMALLANPTLGLPATAAEFETTDYSAGLSLDYIAPPTLVAGVDEFGTFVGGGTALFWSDMLGRHTVATLLQVSGGLKDIAAVVGYENRRSRWTWGGVGSQIPTVSRLFRQTPGQVLGQPVVFQQIFTLRQISREAAGFVSYPFNRVRRIEFAASFTNITYDSEVETRAVSPFTGGTLFRDEEDLPPCSEVSDEPSIFLDFCDPDALNLVRGSGALVYDNSFFGGTGPVLGQRYRFELTPVVGSLNFLSGLADYRRYVQLGRTYTLAGRLLHFGRYVGDAEDGRLYPLFLGYQALVRGYEPNSFNAEECPQDPAAGCPVIDELFGSRVFVANFEFRFPLLTGIGLRHPTGLPPLDLAFFFDAGVAWWTSDGARRFNGHDDPWDPVSSYGVSLRFNAFGIAILELDFVHPNDRPEKGWIWQFGFTPGF